MTQTNLKPSTSLSKPKDISILSKPDSRPSFTRSAFLALSLLTLLVICLYTSRLHLRSLYKVRLVATSKPASIPDRLLFLTPRSGGFNNQLITIYTSIICARQKNRTAVLPLMFENVRYDTNFNGEGPFPFEDFFDIDALRKVVDVTTPALLQDTSLPCRNIYLRTSAHFLKLGKLPWPVSRIKREVPRLIAEVYAKRFGITGVFGDPDKDGDEACIDDSFCGNAPELGTYSAYNVSGQGYNIRESKDFRLIRAAFKPSQVVMEVAEHMLSQLPSKFNALHIRRGDYSYKCGQMKKECDIYGREAFFQSGGHVIRSVKKLKQPDLPVYISTTHVAECQRMLGGLENKMFFGQDLDVPEHLKWAEKRVDIMALASRIVASRAVEFIGNRFSSFSSEISNMRYLRNEEDRLLYF